MTEIQLIERLKNGDRAAQRELYDRYSRLLFWVARKYLSKKEEAEEALLNGFFKAMTQIERFEGRGSFEGWLRRIVVNESLMMLRSRSALHFPIDEARLEGREDDFDIEADLSARDILALLERLPQGCRTVFSLYAIDGLRHHEIADALGISINTSKSQLIVAREKLREMVKKQFNF